MEDESISGFLETVAKHPALVNNKNSIEPGQKEQCSELYIQLLEKVFDSFDKIPNNLKESIPGYDRRIFEKVKLLKIQLHQILAKPDSVSGSQSVIDPDNGDNTNDSGLESSRLHPICIQNGAHNSGTLTSAPRSSTPQGPRNNLLLKNCSSRDAFLALNTGSYSMPPTSPCKRKTKSFFLKPPSVTIKFNKEVPPYSSETIRNALEILQPMTVTETPTRSTAAQSETRLQRPQLINNSLLKSNKPSTDSVNDIKDGEPRDDYGVVINFGNDTNVTTEAAEVSNNSVSGASSDNLEEGNILFDVPVDEFGWQRYREEDFETGNRNLSEQVIGQERGKNYSIKKPPSVTVESNKEVPPSSSERIKNALEILKPMTLTEAPRRAPAAQSYTQLQRPQLINNPLLNSNRPSTDSVNDNRNGEPRNYYGVPINIGNDTNVTTEAAEVSNNSVSGASSDNVEEGNILFDVPVDEFGWQRYREEDFETGNRNLSEQVIGQERGKNYSIKKPPSVTVESNKEVPPSSSERIKNALEILKPMTLTEAPRRASAAQSYTQLQRPQLINNPLLNSNRPSTDSVNDNRNGEPRNYYGVPINIGNDTNVTTEAAEVSNNSVSGASSDNVEEGNILFDVPVDEFGWQRYREEDFETGNRNLSEQVIGQERGKNYSIKKPPSVTVESNKEVPPSSSERIKNALEILKPMTLTEAPRRAPAAQSYTRLQRPQLINNPLLNSNRPSTDSVKDTNVTPEAAEVSNNYVSGARNSNVEEENIIFDVPVDELGWQRYREDYFQTGNRNQPEQVSIGKERNKQYLFKKPLSVTIEPNEELSSSTAGTIRNAPLILKSLTARKVLKCAPIAQSSVDFQPPPLLNSNRPSAYSVKDNEQEGEPIDNYDVLIDLDHETDKMLEVVHASTMVNDSIATTSNADVVNSADLDLHFDEDGWQVYRPEDFEENVKDIGNREPQVTDVIKNSGDTDHHASIQNDGISGEFDGFRYPHSALMLDIFFERFGLTSFRPNQLQVINATLLGHDCFVLMPTGGGKSLCYQLPAILMPGVTIVISPLKSLILDQVNKLLSLNIPAAHLSGDLSQSTCDEIYRKLSLHEPALKLLYVTPEKISSSIQLKSMLSELYSRGKLARFVIDEAHCVSQWGHDFRPDYKRLSVLRTQFPSTNIIALTATATPRVRTDILHQLQVSTCKWFVSSFNRPNLAYRILDKNPRTINQDVVTVIKEQFAGLSGIVYCLSRKECEKLSADLRVAGVLAEFYHGGRSDRKRGEVQAGWAAGTYEVICATIAFGMGVDKADVRYVIHHSMPKSVEGYYQEAGRAGRDGDTAICLLYYSYSDVTRYKRMIYTERNGTSETVRMHIKNLRSMVEVCETETECRREQVLAYLGEQYERTDCMRDSGTACDNCLNEDTYKQVDVTEDCKLIVRCIHETCSGPHASFTLLQVADALRGSMQARLQALQGTPLHGRLMSWTRTDVMRLLRQMLVLRFLADGVSVNNNNPNTYVATGSDSAKLLSGEQRVLFAVKEQPVPAGGGGCAGDEACDGPASKRARVHPALSNDANNPRPGTSRSVETYQGQN